MSEENQEIVTIKSLNKKGFGTSEDVKGNILGAIPGEKATLKKIFGKHKRALYVLEDIIEKSDDRITPKCKHFGSCGGCSFQHISYQKQLAIKKEKIEELFTDSSVSVSPIVGMDDPFYYRGKMEYTFSQNKEKEKFLGLKKPKSPIMVENLEECYLTDPWFTDVLQKVRTFWQESDLLAYNCKNDKGSLQTLTVRKSLKADSKMIMLTVSGNSDYSLTKQQIRDFQQAIGDEECTIFIQIKCISKGVPTRFYEMQVQGKGYLEEKIGDTLFTMSPKAFFQPNPIIAEKFFTAIREKLALTKEDSVLDLFSGIGTIGILLSPFVKHVVSVEMGKEAVLDARENIERLELENIEVYSDDVSNFLSSYGSNYSPDVVVIDPPRVGIGKVAIDFIETVKPKKIAYLSCNPSSQKEDIEQLHSYRIESITPFDQFPHTPHVENLVILSLK